MTQLPQLYNETLFKTFHTVSIADAEKLALEYENVMHMNM